VVVSFTEVVYLVLARDASLLAGLGGFVLPVLLGNTVGAVVLATVVNHFQTTEERLDSARRDGSARWLTLREWVLSSGNGRSYVPEGPRGDD
jgi:type II secretory pathway pseudopilin PulG